MSPLDEKEMDGCTRFILTTVAIALWCAYVLPFAALILAPLYMLVWAIIGG